MTELQQTKNKFKVVGKVTRLGMDGSFREEEAKKGKMEGKLYRSLRFGVQTSETNTITVEMFDFEPDKIFLWNSEKRKKDQSYKGEKVEFEKWFNNQEKYRDEGYAVLQTRIGLEYKEDGKIDSKGMPSYLASEYINNVLENGDSVIIEGEIRYSTYENQQGKVVERKTYTIKNLHKIKDIDFEDEKFEEVSYFEQEMVFVDAEIDKTEKKAYVTGRVIDYQKNFHDTEMVIDFSDGDKGMEKLATTFAKKLKFGDVLEVFGETLNRVIVEEREEDDDDETDLLSDLGGKAKPKHAQSYVARTYITEMQIHGVEAWDEKVYTEDDFVKDDLVEENDLSNDFGGKKKPKEDNPFASDDDNTIDISDEDLPF